MAHLNIDERRKAVKKLLIKYNNTDIRMIAKEFGCSVSVVFMDIAYLKRKHKIALLVGKRQRERIFIRDNYTCQYCGCKPNKCISEHVIPVSSGGVGSDYNIVCACQNCNMKKRKKVWIPKNFSVLSDLNNEWASKIISLSTKDCRIEKVEQPFEKKPAIYQKGSGVWKRKKILQYSIDMVFVKEHESLASASLEIGIAVSSISCCLTGRTKTAGGFMWKHKTK